MKNSSASCNKTTTALSKVGGLHYFSMPIYHSIIQTQGSWNLQAERSCTCLCPVCVQGPCGQPKLSICLSPHRMKNHLDEEVSPYKVTCLMPSTLVLEDRLFECTTFEARFAASAKLLHVTREKHRTSATRKPPADLSLSAAAINASAFTNICSGLCNSAITAEWLPAFPPLHKPIHAPLHATG